MDTPRSIRDGLATAACALIGAAIPSAVHAVEIDASMLYYTEGNRVSVNEGIFNIRRALGDNRYLEATLTYDIMTGASPNGAIASNEVQVFTRPSGRGGYFIAPGQIPVEDTFQDNRVALAASFTTPMGQRNTAEIGAHFSIEYDYLSAGANARFTRDFNKRNTTLVAGVALAWDVLSPQGGIPIPYASMAPPGSGIARTDGTDDKIVGDVIFGVTQVIDRQTIARLNYTLSVSSGYHTDPYKIISVVDPAGNPSDYLYERRPDSRQRHSIYAIVKRHLARDVAEASYRWAADDWGIRSNTLELRYRIKLSGRRFLQPQWRFYHQRAADFHRAYFLDSEPLPEYASAEYRLGEFSANTFALKYGVTITEAHEVNVRIGVYRQAAVRGPPDPVANLRDMELFPAVQAYMMQIGYTALLDY